MKLKCLVVDDEKLARDLLADYLRKLPQLELVSCCHSAIEAQAILNEQTIDLIFLDIQMPDLNGIDFLKTLQHPPLTILTTAYSEHALEGYALNVVDYLLKPIVFERFFQAVNKAIAQLAKQVQNPVTVNLQSPTNSTESNRGKYIFVKADNKIHKVDFDAILYIESLREYVRIHTASQKIMTRQSLSKLLDILPQEQFTRIHRTYIINIQHIRHIEGNLVHLAEVELPISKGKREEFLQVISKKGLL